jgi:undecaprenyl-diphosphatase
MSDSFAETNLCEGRWARVTLTSHPNGRISAVLAYARTEVVLLAALALIAGSMLGFIEIADDMREEDGRAFDWTVLRLTHPSEANPADPVGPSWLDHASADFTALGSVTILVALVVAACGYLLLRRRALEALLLVLAAGGGLAISQALKAFFERDRPPEIYRAAEVLNQSFPSGHAMLSAVVYLTLGAMLARAEARRRIRIYIMALAILVALGVGLTRVHLGVHWASDVLAGWCAGAAWATACWLLDRWLRRRIGEAN